MKIQELFAFIKERHDIYLRRQVGKPKPWTTDKILQQYRFTNCYRELDVVTTWIREHWRVPYVEHSDVWFAMTVARFVNRPESLVALGRPLPWRPKNFIKMMESFKQQGDKAYSSAYMINAVGMQGHNYTSKAAYLADQVLGPLWRERAKLRPRHGDKLADFAGRLLPYHGMGGGFMTAQVIADTKFTEPLKSAEDWWTWAAPGPGSRRGLNRVLGRAVDQPWKDDEWLRQLNLLQTKIDPLVRAAGMPRLSGQDLQNCLCEYFKYSKVITGTGRPKQLYPGV
jgi:hypothetical protein